MLEVSVIMPVYNTDEKYLKEAIESILNQTFKDFELIIINDCSTNNAEEVIFSYKDERIAYLKNEQNLGVSASVNIGLDKARGKYIARMDSDDVSLENRFKIQYEFLKNNPEYQLCSTRITKAKKRASSRMMNFEYLKTKLLFRGNPIIQPTVMFNREFFIENALYYKNIPYGEDWDLWARLSFLGKFVVLPERLVYYRQHPQQANKIYADRHYEATKLQFKENLRLLGFKSQEDSEEILINFLACIEHKISFKEWKSLVIEIRKLLKFVKDSGEISYKYSLVILFKKFISYTKHCLLA